MLKKTIFSFLLFASFATSAPALEASANAMCPVMQKERVKKKFHSTWKGQEVYFCCRSCVKRFKKDPKKYAENLSS